MKDMVIGYLGEKGNTAKMTDEFLKSGDSYRIALHGRTVSNNLSTRELVLTRELVMGIQVGDDKTYNRTYTCSATNKYGTDSWSVKIMRDYS